MPTNGMTIDSLNTVSSLTAQDEVPVWDKEASGEPTRKITAQNMTNSVKTLGSLVNTTEMNNAIAQSTADVIRTGDVVNSLTSGEPMPPSAGCVYDAVNSVPTSVVTTLYRIAFGRIALISGEFAGNGTGSQSTGLTGWIGAVNVRNKATGVMSIYFHSNASGEILGWDGSTTRTFEAGTIYQVSGVLYLA